jgi:hypothetical protein
MPIGTSSQPGGIPAANACASKPAPTITVISAMPPRYSSEGKRAAVAQGLGAGTAHLRRALELWQTLVDQVEADVPGAMAIASAAASSDRDCAHARQLDRLAGDLALGQVALPRDRSRWHGDSDRGWQNPSAHRRRPDPRAACSTTLMVSTKSRQSIAPSTRRLPMLLLIET